jgi:uncharacterized protein (DUF305 family)
MTDVPSRPVRRSVMASWLGSPLRLVVLGVALLFLAGAVGYALGHPEEETGGSADVGFLQDMIVHHEQAVEISYGVVTAATDAEVRTYAKDIITAQQYEIGLMDGWLRRWHQPRESDSKIAMRWAGMSHPKASMPGMATAKQLKQLKDASGGEVDDRFLALMIRHHAGGVSMAEAALKRAHDGEVLKLAVLIIRAQKSEIGEMQSTRLRLGLPRAKTSA